MLRAEQRNARNVRSVDNKEANKKIVPPNKQAAGTRNTNARNKKQPAFLNMLSGIYRDTSLTRAYREALLAVVRKRELVGLPAEYARYWHSAFSAAVDPQRSFANESTNAVAARLGAALADVLQEPRYKEQKFLKVFMIRALCAANRVSQLYDPRLKDVVARSGCYARNELPRDLSKMGNEAIKMFAIKFDVSKNKPDVLKRVESMIRQLPPKEARKVRPIIERVEKFLYDEYERILTQNYGGKSGSVASLYEKILQSKDALTPLLQRIQEIGQRAYVAKITRDMEFAQTNGEREMLRKQRDNYVQGRALPVSAFSGARNAANAVRKLLDLPVNSRDRQTLTKYMQHVSHIQTLIDLRRRIDARDATGQTLEIAYKIVKAFREGPEGRYVLFKNKTININQQSFHSPQAPGLTNLLRAGLLRGDRDSKGAAGAGTFRNNGGA